MTVRLDPVGGVREWIEPMSTPFDRGLKHTVRYELAENLGYTFNVVAPKRPPDDLFLSVEIAEDNGAFYMRATEIDVSVEGDSPAEAIRELSEAVKDWLEYLREEKPALVADLENQRRYVALLDFAPLTWFRARTVG